MALRYLGLQIAQAREETGETDYSDTNGVPQSVPVQAAREAVIHCQNSLYLAAPQIFDTVNHLTPVVGQLEYSLPTNAFLGSSIASVEYSPSGSDVDYYKLSLSDYGYRAGGSGDPQRFIPYGDGKILIDQPVAVTGGKFRLICGASLDEPDIRRGKIKSVTKDGPMTNYLTIELEDDANLDTTAIQANEFLCVNDKNGSVTYYNVYYSAYDTGSRVLTLDPATAVSAGTIDVGSYITLGKYTTTHIKLSGVADPVIMSYIRRRFYLTKSSEDAASEEDNIAAFTKEMVAVYRRRVRTQKKIPFTGRFERLGRV